METKRERLFSQVYCIGSIARDRIHPILDLSGKHLTFELQAQTLTEALQQSLRPHAVTYLAGFVFFWSGKLEVVFAF